MSYNTSVAMYCLNAVQSKVGLRMATEKEKALRRKMRLRRSYCLRLVVRLSVSLTSSSSHLQPSRSTSSQLLQSSAEYLPLTWTDPRRRSNSRSAAKNAFTNYILSTFSLFTKRSVAGVLSIIRRLQLAPLIRDFSTLFVGLQRP